MTLPWPTQPLEEVVEELIDYRGKSPRKVGSGVPLITARIVKGGRIGDPEEFIAEEDYESWMRRGMPQKGDVVLTTEAPLGEVGFLPHSRVALAQRIILLRGKPGVLDTRFLGYALQAPMLQAQLQSRASGTTVSGIRQSELRRIAVPLPSIAEQRAIAAVLEAVDDTIENNQRMGDLMHQLARRLFDQMMQESDSTEVVPIGELAAVKGGATPSTAKEEYWGGGLAWATPKDLAPLRWPVLLSTERTITDEGAKQISSGLMPQGTVLMSSRAPVGYLAIAAVPVAVNQGFIAMVPKAEVSSQFLLRWAESAMDEIKARANGTTFLEISKSSFRPIEVVLPPRDLRDKFDHQAGPLHELMVSVLRETALLTKVRDYLLPRLMDSRLRVRQDERVLGAVS